MMLLGNTHPDAHKKLSEGEFAVQMGNTNGVGQTPVDQTIEETINRDSKVKGGIIGFNKKKNTVQRWILTPHERAAFTQLCKRMVGSTRNEKGKHKESSKTRMNKDEHYLQKVQNTNLSWGNPFEPGGNIRHLASGITVSSAITEDLEKAEQKGKEELNGLFADGLLAENVPLHNNIPKLLLKTISYVTKGAIKVKVAGHDATLKADRDLFASLAIIAHSRDMSMREALQHTPGPLPWSLATLEGTVAKTVKSKRLHYLERDIDPAEDIPLVAPWIFDGMALLHSITAPPNTFAELALLLFNKMHISRLASRVDFVTDQYPEISIKQAE